MNAIKVEHTKTHQIGNPIKNQYALVTDAELMLVECKPEEALFNLIENGLPEGILRLHTKGRFIAGRYFKPIPISRTEKIEEGDWYLHYNSGTKEYSLFKADLVFNNGNDPNDIDPRGNILPYGNKKLLALPEHFSPKHLQAIVDGKLKDGDKVLVECDTAYELNGKIKPMPHEQESKVVKVIKLQLGRHITLHKVEEKMYTREEVYQIYLAALSTYKMVLDTKKDWDTDKWFNNNVK